MGRSRRRSRQEWREIAKRWQQSGLSGVEFARAEGLNANTFGWWRSELAREQQETTRKGREAPLTLIGVRNVEAPAPQFIEAVLPAGVIVRIPNTGDLQRSADLIAILLVV